MSPTPEVRYRRQGSNLRISQTSLPSRSFHGVKPSDLGISVVPGSPTDAKLSPGSTITKSHSGGKKKSWCVERVSQPGVSPLVLEDTYAEAFINSSEFSSLDCTTESSESQLERDEVNNMDMIQSPSGACVHDSVSSLIGAETVPCPALCPILLGCLHSEYAQKLMDELRWPCTVKGLEIDKAGLEDREPHEAALHYASEGIETLQLGTLPPSLVVFCAQVVDFQDSTRLKPESTDMAQLFLSSYTGSVVRFVTGVEVKNMETGNSAKDVGIAHVHFGNWKDDELLHLISKRSGVMVAPGALDLQDKDIEDHIEHIDGAMGSALGVPINVVGRLIRQVI